MIRHSWIQAIALFSSWLVGCASSQVIETYEPADSTIYADHVHAYVTMACGALHCHGDSGRPLRIYSELGLRIEPGLRTIPVDIDHPPTPITDEELQENVTAFSTVSPLQAGLKHFALQKPLAGAVDHVGGDLFKSTTDPGYLCLRSWLVPNSADGVDVASECADALAALDF